MKNPIQSPSDERDKRAHKKLWLFVSKHRIAVAAVGVILLFAAISILAYYRAHRGIWIADVTLVKSQKGRVNDELSITLNDVIENPDRQKLIVSATVEYRNLPDMKISNASEGYIVTYPKEHGYKIELVKVSAKFARFSVTKKP